MPENNLISLQALVQDGVTELWKTTEIPRLIIDADDIDAAIEVFRWVAAVDVSKSEAFLAVVMLENIRGNYLNNEGNK